MKIIKEFIGKVRWEEDEGFYITDINDPIKFRLHFDQELTNMVGKIIKITVTYEEVLNCCVNCEQITIMENKKRNCCCNKCAKRECKLCFEHCWRVAIRNGMEIPT